jgi:hypothetical protein
MIGHSDITLQITAQYNHIHKVMLCAHCATIVCTFYHCSTLKKMPLFTDMCTVDTYNHLHWFIFQPIKAQAIASTLSTYRIVIELSKTSEFSYPVFKLLPL